MIAAVILCALRGWIPELLLHEAAHAIVYRLGGRRVVTFIACPHWLDGRFRFGQAGPDRAMDRPWIFRNNIAPALKATTMLALWLPLGFFVGPWAFALAGWELVDLGNFWQGWFRRRPNDGGKARVELEILRNMRAQP